MGKKKRFPSKQQTPKRGEGCRFLKMIKMVIRMINIVTWTSAIMITMLMIVTSRKRREPLRRSSAPESANSACSPRGRREGRFY